MELDPAAPRVWLDGEPAAMVTILRQPDATEALGAALGQVLAAAAVTCSPGIEVREIGAGQAEVDLAVAAEGGLAVLLEATGRASAAGLLEVGRPLPGTRGLVDPGRTRWTTPVPVDAALAALGTQPGIEVRGWRGAGAHTIVWLGGPERESVADGAAALRDRLGEVGCVADDGLGQQRPQLGVRPDRVRLAASGIPLAVVTDAVQAATTGVPAGQVLAGGERLPIVLRLGDGGASEALGALVLAGSSPLPFSAVAALTSQRAPQALRRRGGQPAVRLEFSCLTERPAKVQALVEQVIAAQPLPAGVAVEVEEVEPAGFLEEIRARVERR